MAGPRRSPGRSRGSKRSGGRDAERPGPHTPALPLPKDTAKLLDTSRRPGHEDNVGLWLDKFVYRRRTGSKDDWKIEKDDREYGLAPFTRSWRSPLGEQALARRRSALQQTYRTDGDALYCELHARVQGRLLVDYGRASAVEAALSFHHTWGVPRIPGSAIKGIALLAMKERGAGAGDIDADIEAIFGTQPDHSGKLPKVTRAGQMRFFDALPREGAFTLADDVLTPHYGPYYRDGQPPGDWHSPVPHTFLTVVDTVFVFHLAAQPLPGVHIDQAREWLRKVHEALLEAFQWHGIGAKTAAGYGRLKKEDPPPDATVQELAAWLEAQKRDRTPQRRQLELLRSEWRERLLALSETDRRHAAEAVRKAIKSPKLADQRDAFLQELSES